MKAFGSSKKQRGTATSRSQEIASGRLADGLRILARFATYYWGKAKGQQSEEMLSFVRVLLKTLIKVQADLQIHTVLQHGASQLPVLHARRLALLQQPTPDARSLISITKYIRVIGKWMKGMIATNGKDFVRLNETTDAIGWWWNMVGHAVRSGEITNSEFGM